MAADDVLGRRVKQVCVSHGVRVLTLSGYRSFALQVDKTRRRVSGRDLELIVGALVGRYVKLGLERKVLADIAYHVFNVRVPVARR
jgi:hypothetical protein